jgi:hypothetical protein|nr:MAG TPA: hypothetical protein [Caudoviricetes sp.]
MSSKHDPPYLLFRFDHKELVVLYRRKPDEDRLIYTFHRLASGAVEIFTRRCDMKNKPVAAAVFELPGENIADAIVTMTDASRYVDILSVLPWEAEVIEGLPADADTLIRERIPGYYN